MLDIENFVPFKVYLTYVLKNITSFSLFHESTVFSVKVTLCCNFWYFQKIEKCYFQNENKIIFFESTYFQNENSYFQNENKIIFCESSYFQNENSYFQNENKIIFCESSYFQNENSYFQNENKIIFFKIILLSKWNYAWSGVIGFIFGVKNLIFSLDNFSAQMKLFFLTAKCDF